MFCSSVTYLSTTPHDEKKERSQAAIQETNFKNFDRKLSKIRCKTSYGKTALTSNYSFCVLVKLLLTITQLELHYYHRNYQNHEIIKFYEIKQCGHKH